jgi:hypothetical protein
MCTRVRSGSAAVYSIQGLRAHMEDAFVCDENLPHGRALYGAFEPNHPADPFTCARRTRSRTNIHTLLQVCLTGTEAASVPSSALLASQASPLR